MDTGAALLARPCLFRAWFDLALCLPAWLAARRRRDERDYRRDDGRDERRDYGGSRREDR
jgi:hypothetical protein